MDFQLYLKLPAGIPSHDILERAFHAIRPEEFSGSFIHWVKNTFNISDEELIHIDGKSARRSGDSFKGNAMLHLVSAFAGTYHLSLAQVKVSDKSNEITAVPELLQILDIENETITIDAMGCQTGIAEQIIAQKGDYILAVKENQQSLLEQVDMLFDEDHCRKHKNNAAENFVLVRKTALNIIRAYKGDKRSLKKEGIIIMDFFGVSENFEYLRCFSDYI